MKTFMFAFCCYLSAAAAAGTATWTNSAPNTPDTAYDWCDSGNWQGGEVGGEGDDVVLPDESVYIRVPDSGVTVRRLQNLYSKAFVIGGDIRLLSAGEGTDSERRAILETSAKIYCDIVIPPEETICPYFKGVSTKGTGYQLCGRILNENTSGVYPQTTDGSVYHNFRYFANGGGAERTENLVSAGPIGINGGAVFFMAPEGGAAASGSWELKEGSPYAMRRSASKHTLAVGTHLGQGLPDGTFLKRVFDDATIELSEPATVSGTATLSFAALTTDFTATLGTQFYQHGNYCNLFFYKNRTANKARLEIADFNSDSMFKTISMYLGNNSDGTPCGTFVFHKVSGAGLYRFIGIRSVHLEFAGDDTGTTAFSDTQPFEMPKVNGNKLSARFTVTNNITGIVSVLSNFHGKITKDGGGLLQLGLGNDIADGSLIAEAGVLKLTRRIPAGAGEFALASLTIKSGATVELPEGGLAVSNLIVEAGAILRGNARLTVLDGADRTLADPRDLVCPDGASVAYVFEGGITFAKDMFAAGSTILVAGDGTLAAGSADSGALVKDGSGTLKLDGFNAETLAVHAGTVSVSRLDRSSAIPAGAWIHVDADDASTIKTYDAWPKRIQIWSDVNGSGRSFRNHRDNAKESCQATVVPDGINGRTVIDLGPYITGSSSILIYHNEQGERSLNYNGDPATMEAPLLRTALLVYDSSRGGGCLLGGLGGYVYQKGLLPRWETNTVENSRPIVCSHNDPTKETHLQIAVNSISNACENGTAVFRRDGEVCNPAVVCFKRAPELVSFRYPSGRRNDVLGGYGSASGGNAMGAIKYGEVILFERELTESETLFAEAYLAKKWFNRKVPGYGAPSATSLFVETGATLALAGDEPFAAKLVSGGGTLEGSLKIAEGGTIAVAVGADGTLPELKVTACADISAGGTVVVEGRLDCLAEGDFRILAAQTMALGGKWSLKTDFASTRHNLSVSAGEDGVVLHVRRNGMVIVVR